MSTYTPPPALAALAQPLTIGPLTVRNRVMMGPTTLHYAEDNVLGDRHIEFYAERARGGAGLLVTEEHGAFRLGIGAFATACTAWHERAISRFAALAEVVHGHGAHQLVQLYAPGAKDGSDLVMDHWRAPWAPSRVPSPDHGSMPQAMDRAQIAEVVDGFARSARNVELGGLDGVEIHAAHAWLVGQFLSPHYNRRSDGYGGSISNRCRLALEIGEAIRVRTTGLVMGIQLSLEEHLGAAGITLQDTEDQLELLAASGLFDYVTLSTGGTHSGHLSIPTMEVADGFLSGYGQRVKKIVGDRMKVVLVGRIRTPELAARLIDEGCADMVAMTRAQFADPYLVRKSLEGRVQDIVPCIGENDCIVRALGARLPVTCLMNPAMGHEARLGSAAPAARPPRAITVIGGGPGGLKLAAVAARRGHRVVLLERAGSVGGHLRPLSRLPHRAAWREAIASLEHDARAAGVEIRCGVEADRRVVEATTPDVVVCATGATWDSDGVSPALPGRMLEVTGGASVHDVGGAVDAALADPLTLGAHVVIIDETGEYLPLGLADLLSGAGVHVEVVSRHPVVGLIACQALEGPHVLGRLAARDADLIAGHHLLAVEGDQVRLREDWSGRGRVLTTVDTVVLSLLRTPDDALFHELVGVAPDVRRIGDALAPRRTHETIHEAEETARVI